MCPLILKIRFTIDSLNLLIHQKPHVVRIPSIQKRKTKTWIQVKYYVDFSLEAWLRHERVFDFIFLNLFFHLGHSNTSFLFHSISYQLSNWWATFCHYFSMFQYNLLHLDIFKRRSFQCGSVLFIRWHDSHRGLTVQAVPCTEFGSEETGYTADLF